MAARRRLARAIRLALLLAIVVPPVATVGALVGWNGWAVLTAGGTVLAGGVVATGSDRGWVMARRLGRALAVVGMGTVALSFLFMPFAGLAAVLVAFGGGVAGVVLLVYGSFIDYLAEAGQDAEPKL